MENTLPVAVSSFYVLIRKRKKKSVILSLSLIENSEAHLIILEGAGSRWA